MSSEFRTLTSAYINGNLTVLDTVYAGSIGNSQEWGSTHSTVAANSANWQGGIANVEGLSANWESTYTTVRDTSAIWDDQADLTDIIAASGDWNSVYTTVQTESADWESTHTTVQDNSATWDDQADLSELQAASGDWNSVYTTVNVESGDWESTYSTVEANSANWQGGIANVSGLSANWESTYTTVRDTSAIWDDQADLTDIIAASGDWNSTYTTVQTTSSDWVTYTATDISTAGWVLDQDNLAGDGGDNGDGSPIKLATQQSIKFYIDSIVTGVNTLKGGYDAGTDTPALTAGGVGTLSGDTYYITESGTFYGNDPGAQDVDPGDLIIAIANDANTRDDWIVINRNIQDELIDKWNSNYTTVQNNSAEWADHFDATEIQAASGDWNSTYTTVNVESGDWEGTYSTVAANSANWQGGIANVSGLSANWESTYTTVRDTSGTWDDQADLTDLIAASGDWNSTYTTVNAESGDWESVYTSVNTTSADWNDTRTTVQTNSASWDGDFCNETVLMKRLSSCPGTDTISISANLDLNGYSLSGVGNASIAFESGAKISSNVAADVVLNTDNVVQTVTTIDDYSKTSLFRAALTTGSNNTATFSIGTDPQLSTAKLYITYTSATRETVIEVFVGNLNGACKSTEYSELNHNDNDKILNSIGCAFNGGNLEIISNVVENCDMVINGYASYVSQ